MINKINGITANPAQNTNKFKTPFGDRIRIKTKDRRVLQWLNTLDCLHWYDLKHPKYRYVRPDYKEDSKGFFSGFLCSEEEAAVVHKVGKFIDKIVQLGVFKDIPSREKLLQSGRLVDKHTDEIVNSGFEDKIQASFIEQFAGDTKTVVVSSIKELIQLPIFNGYKFPKNSINAAKNSGWM